ncbi:MAG: cupin domain-containing protein [Verrucomicrobiota bacterium]|nr:cupin domain-containing protein [Verrucomicrobiota bacterium]|tara:strand:+ start:84 stop:413 length:330 start_codon:yes stop_codon:yes gene_type:complete
MFQYTSQADEKDWILGPYEGVKLKILHKDEKTGGIVTLRKFEAGTKVPAHTHPKANEWAYIISGEWQESETVYSKGTLFHAPKGKKHGPHIAKTDVISLTHFDGPLTVE